MRRNIFLIAIILCGAINVCTAENKFDDVIAHYSRNANDSMKLKAAKFIIKNIHGHFSPGGDGMEEFINRIYATDSPQSQKALATAWNKARGNDRTILEADSSLMDSQWLIEEIDQAFVSWKTAPWADEITFDNFCRHILPYRVKDERICKGWRQKLRKAYGPAVANTESMTEAFEAITDTIRKTILQSTPYCPYSLDALTTNYVKKADCDQRCILHVAVLRALGIPAAIDAVPMWANYSQNGHSWVAMVKSDGATYTIFDDEKGAKQFNKIDASRFSARYKITREDSCPYDVLYEKKAAKIYRLGFEHTNTTTQSTPSILNDRFISNVSAQYGLGGTLTVECNDTIPVYLCVFRSGKNWTPIAQAQPINGLATFKYIGCNTVYLPMCIKGKKWTALSEPILINDNGTSHTYTPATNITESITINRKYPLCSYMTDLWGYMKGGVFEGANDADFSDADTIGAITRMPHGETTIPISKEKKYRYLRYKTSPRSRMPLAELHFYTKDENGKDIELNGTPIWHDVDSTGIKHLTDWKPETVTSAKTTNYWIGTDLGAKGKNPISKIVFMPSSDTNNVEAGDLYELYYFDRQWHLLGRRMANSGILTFDNVPKNAILLLKDKTKGKEERIFEYKNGTQIWH